MKGTSPKPTNCTNSLPNIFLKINQTALKQFKPAQRLLTKLLNLGKISLVLLLIILLIVLLISIIN